MSTLEKRRLYWTTNLRIVLGLLALWFLASYGAAILFADELDAIRIGGFKLGFWMGQQGSIVIFLLIVITYIFLMNRLDREHDVHED